MQRIQALDFAAAPPASQVWLSVIHKKLGMVPNLLKTIAHSPAALRSYVQQTEALATGELPAALREQIALVTAGTNACDYCASAHTLLGKQAGLNTIEAADNLRGRAAEPRVRAALTFAQAIVQGQGRVSDAELQAVRDAGYGNAEIVEMVAHVALNIFTNYFNHIAGTVVDFPLVRARGVDCNEHEQR
jgi:uncharacterized peroxidase-related enzyme